MSRASIFLMITGMASTSAVGQVSNSRTVGGWFLAEMRSPALSQPECIASKRFADGTNLELTLGAKTGTMKISFENRDWTSLNAMPEQGIGGDIKMPATLTFVGAGYTWNGSLTVLKQSRYNPTPSIYTWMESTEASAMLGAFAGGSSVKVSNESRAIGEYPLTASASAIRELRGCAQAIRSEEERQKQNDPFRL